MAENVKVSFYVPEKIDREVEEMVEQGIFTTKSDVYQEALRRLLLVYRKFEVDDDLGEKLKELADG